jgi:hypothetical protein
MEEQIPGNWVDREPKKVGRSSFKLSSISVDGKFLTA